MLVKISASNVSYIAMVGLTCWAMLQIVGSSPDFKNKDRITQMQHRIIEIHALAPAKPSEGQPCNGCGICCIAEPCPLGMLISLKRTGRCKAVRWVAEFDESAQEVAGRYVCSALLPEGNSARNSGFLFAIRRWAVRRWIGAGQGCDCSL